MGVDLKAIPLIAGMPDEALQALAQRAALRSLPARCPVIREGDLPQALYLVISGKVKVFLGSGDEEVLLATKGPGDYFGEMMLDDRPRSASVTTLEPSTFAVLSREVFTGFLRENPDVALRLIRDLIRMGRGMNTRARESFRQRIEALERSKIEELSSVRRWHAAKWGVLFGLLVLAAMQIVVFASR